jgi:AraC-like DNA-binding protein
MAYHRGSDEISVGDGEHFLLVLAQKGHGAVEQRSVCTAFSAGDMVIYSSMERSVISFPESSTTQVVKVPSSLLEDRVASTDRIAATLLDGSTPMGSLAKNLVRESINLSLGSADPGARLACGVLDILAAVIESNLPADPGRQFDPQLASIKRYVEEHITDPGLNVHEIAQRNNISVRTLNRLFAAAGTTANSWIWSRRLANSYKLLSEGKVTQVTQAAYECGFNDLSHFGRAFKKRYGRLPHEVLRGGR